jgi:pyruvate dehydrogenase E1 component
VPGRFSSLGADGFGLSDTRAAARRHFKIDGPSVVVKVLQQLAVTGDVAAHAPAEAVDKYQLHDVTAGTSGNAGGES